MRPESKRWSIASAVSAILVMAFAPLACGESRSFVDDSKTFPEAGTLDGPQCGYRCSRDLKQVLEVCEGQSEIVKQVCSADEGCGVDTCVSACTAAELSKGSVGCSFWTLPPDDASYGAGTCFAAMIANTWDRPVSITAEWGADPLDISRSIYTASRISDEPEYTKLEGPLAPGQVAIVFLAQKKVETSQTSFIRCPEGVTPAVDVDPIKHGTARTKAFRIVTDAPVSAYSSFPYGGASSEYPSATLLLPESSWEKAYIGVTVGLLGDPEKIWGNERTMQIIAKEDGTKVSMKPRVDLSGAEGIEPVLAGQVRTWSLNRGEVLQFTQAGLISGSAIEADKPIGLFGASPCAFIPGEHGWCDVFSQQIPPLSQWGTEYALVPYRPRIARQDGTPLNETVAWSFVGAADGTALTWSPSKPPGAPDSLSAGQVVNFMTDAIATVKSQDTEHPFYAAVYMTGSSFGGGSPGSTLGDPDFVNVVASNQYLDHYVFFVDYTYPETSITVVRKKHLGVFSPVTLECGGEITDWRPIGDGSEYEYAWVQLTTGFRPTSFPDGECGYGRHVADSDGPFTLSVWGIGKDASYGYPAGTGARPINNAESGIN